MLNHRLTQISLFLIAVISLLLFAVFVMPETERQETYRSIDGDAKGYYAYLPQLFITHDLKQQSSDQRYFIDIDGKAVNKYYAGTALLEAPFFGLAYLYTQTSGKVIDAYSYPFQLAILISGWFYYLIGFFFLTRVLQHIKIKSKVIAVTLWVFAFGTNLLFYALVEPGMSHIYAWFSINLFIYLSLKLFKDRQYRLFQIWTLTLALIVIIRPVDALVLFCLPLILSVKEIKEGFSSLLRLKNLLINAGLFLGLVSLQFILWYMQSGQILTWSYKGEGFYFLDPSLWDYLFSFRKGAFIYTPLLGLSLFGLVVLFRKNKRQFYIALLFFIGITYVLSAWWNWYYANSFGQRSLVDFSIFFAILFAYLLQFTRPKSLKTTVLIICLLIIPLNLIQSYQVKAGILSSWDMNYEKYRYAFLKTDSIYRGQLGGNKDIIAYHKSQKMIFEEHFGFEFDNNQQQQSVLDYSNKEFKFSIDLPLNADFINNDGLFFELELKRKELETGACNEAFIVFDFMDREMQRQAYYPIKINEVPSNKYGDWKTYAYTVQLHSLETNTQSAKIYIWNPKKKAFLIDDVHIKVSAIYTQ